MKFMLEYPRWKRIKKQLKTQGLLRIPDQYNGKWHNYTLPLNPPKHYPRLHVITTGAIENRLNDYKMPHLRLLEVHVDIMPHSHTEHFHEAITMVQRIIKNTN